MSAAVRTVALVNCDSIEVGADVPEEILARIDAAPDTTLQPIHRDWLPDDGGLFGITLSAECRSSVMVFRDDVDPMIEGVPVSWVVHVDGCWADLDDARNLEILRSIVGYLWDALAIDTDWPLLWMSDDEPGDGIVRERKRPASADR